MLIKKKDIILANGQQPIFWEFGECDWPSGFNRIYNKVDNSEVVSNLIVFNIDPLAYQFVMMTQF